MGTYYKFTTKKGKVLEGFYSQGSPNNWKPLNAKTMVAKYDELGKKGREIKPEATEKDNQLILPDQTVITFSDEQYDALEAIRTWMKGDSNVFTLSGYAGTGKTTIIKKIIKNKIIETTQQDGATLHSLLGLRPDVRLENFDPNSPEFAQDPEKIQIHKYSLVVIDEASMINEKLLELIEKTVTSRTKIIFMGDVAQIPPVGEAISAVFTKYTGENFSQLEETQRLTTGNPLELVYDVIRKNLRRPDGGFDRKTALNDKDEGIRFTNDMNDFASTITQTFNSNDFKNDIDHARVIAWRNVTVAAYNRSIRKSIFGDNAERIEENDLLMGYRTVSRDSGRLVSVQNSADYKVVSRSDKTTSRDGLAGWNVRLETKDSGATIVKDVFIVDPTDEESMKKYAEIHDKFLKAKAWGQYYEFRYNNLLMETIPKGKDGRFKAIIKDLDYGYAITGHKSQGSTYKNVFVVEDDIDKNSKIKERNQIKYVALSRPSHTATVLTSRKIEGKNTFVDKPVPDPVAPPPTLDDIDVGRFSDKDIPGMDGSVFDKVSAVEFVSDEQVDEFMKRCKGE
jgi:hypothetical protein